MTREQFIQLLGRILDNPIMRPKGLGRHRVHPTLQLMIFFILLGLIRCRSEVFPRGRFLSRQ